MAGEKCALVTTVKNGILEEQKYGIIDRNYTPFQSKVLCQREVLLSSSIKKTLVDSQGRRSGEQLIERPWLQLMCCTLVFGCEVVAYFGVIGSHQDRGPRETSGRSWSGQREIRTR